MSAARFRLREVTLAGFGCYAEPTRFLLPESGCVLQGPNESGKSTLLAGLTAVLFGLRSGTDPTERCTSRYRSFSRTREFWGEAVWEAEGRVLRLHRAFESHRVRLTEERNGSARVLYSGEHNPGARSPSGTDFSQTLRREIGLSSLDLFLETFCIAQPLSAEQSLSEELQHLLSGSRSGRIDEVLNRLFAEIKALTKATGDLGLVKPGNERAANQHAPGRIERLETELAEARDGLERGREYLETLNQKNHELEELQARIERSTRSMRESEARLKSLQTWNRLEENRRRSAESLGSITAVLKALDRIDGDRRARESDLEGRFAPYRQAPADLGERLDEVRAAEGEADRLRQEEEATRGQRAGWSDEVARIRGRLEGDLAVVRGRPGLLEVHARLSELGRKREKDRVAAELLDAEIADVEASIAGRPDWSDLNLEALRSHLDAMARDLRRLDGVEARISENAGALEGRRFLAGDRHEALKRKIGLEEQLKEQAAKIRERELELVRRERADALARAEAATASVRRAAEPVGLWIAVSVSFAIAAIIRFGLHQNWMLTVCAAAACFFLLRILVPLLKREQPAPVTTSAPAEPRPGAASANGGSPPAGDEHGASPDDSTAVISELRAERERMETEIAAESIDLGPYARTTRAELARFDERWDALERESEHLAREAEELRRRWWGENSPESWRDAPVSLLPETVRAALRLPAAPALTSCGSFYEWARSLDDPAWENLRAAWQEDQRTRESIGALKAERDRRARLLESRVEETELAERLAPFTAETPVEEVQRLLAECRDAEQALGALERNLEQLPSADEMSEATRQAQTRTEESWTRLRAAWPGGPEIPDGTPALEWLPKVLEEARQARDAWLTDGSYDESAQRILSSAGATDRTELEGQEREEQATLGAIRMEIEKLESEVTFLAASRAVADPMARAAGLRTAEEEEKRSIEAEQRNRDRAVEEERRLHAEQARLEASPAANLAQLEIRGQGLETELERARRERDARVLAFCWIRDAAECFQEAYRVELDLRIAEYFSALTARPGRSVRIDSRFRLSAVEPDGTKIDPAQLSQGTRDQLALAIRLSVADLLTGTIALPLFFDDPFVHCDALRLERLREALERLAASRQWILLTHREDLTSWGEPVKLESGANNAQVPANRELGSSRN